MPQPRSQPRSSAPKPHAASSPRESLSAAEMEALSAFDLVEDALADFQTPAPPELASRREIKAAKEAAKAAARLAARQPAPIRPAPAPKPGAHYFASSPPLAEGQAKGVRVRAAGADLVLQAGAGTFSKSELDEGTEILLGTFAQSDTFAASGEPRWCDLGCGWGAVSCVLATQKPGAKLWACDINRRAVALAHSNARDLGHSVAAWNGDGLSAARSGFFDAILCNPPVRAGNLVIDQLFDDSLRCLREGGELWIVLRTAQGAKSWQKKIAALFGNCDTVQISHGYRILRARKGAEKDAA